VPVYTEGLWPSTVLNQDGAALIRTERHSFATTSQLRLARCPDYSGKAQTAEPFQSKYRPEIAGQNMGKYQATDSVAALYLRMVETSGFPRKGDYENSVFSKTHQNPIPRRQEIAQKGKKQQVGRP
jgi:hypothetical protein